MAKLILPAATDAGLSIGTPRFGEILYNEDRRKLVIGDGFTRGGLEASYDTFRDVYVYGVDINTTSGLNSAAACRRVVLNTMHDMAGDDARYTCVAEFSRMPCHQLRRCVMQNLNDRSVDYYLSSANSALKEDGTLASLDGTDGDVMVEIPVAHWRIDVYRDAQQAVHYVYLISERPFSGSVIHPCFFISPDGRTPGPQYVGAFRGSLFDVNSNWAGQDPVTGNAQFHTADKLRSVAGYKPTWRLSYSNACTCAANAGADLYSYLQHRYIALLITIEFATLNSAQAVSTGFTRLNTRTSAAFRQTGRTVSSGNNTVNVLADDAGPDADLLTGAPDGTTLWHDNGEHAVQFSYRGIEDLWGVSPQVLSGVSVCFSSTADPVTGYTTSTDLYADLADYLFNVSGAPVTAEPTGESFMTMNLPLPTTAGFISKYDSFFCYPVSIEGGTSDTGACDAYYPVSSTGCHLFKVGGDTMSLSDAGVNETSFIKADAGIYDVMYRISC